jgi:protein-S-isoprenylcysteine O-methyltransferase Ste14
MADETSKLTWGRIARRIRVPLGFVFAALYVWLARPTWMSIAAGAVIAAVGVWIRAMASGHVKKNEQLTTTGPYAYTRNPLYLGSIVIAIGFAVAALSVWIGVILVVMFVAIYVPVIRGEEGFLRGTFPEYDDYARRVPRLFPSLSSTANPGGGFSRELYLQHREYNATIGAAVVLLTLIGKLIFLSH